MAIEVIPLEKLKADTEAYFVRCAESGEPLVVELPDHRRVTVQPVPEDDDLIDRLIEENPEFRELLRRSAESPARVFVPRTSRQAGSGKAQSRDCQSNCGG